ncbi:MULTISPECIES: D-ribose pyranase [Gallibacterium]|uniref:D-ribose pyranase n=1 Tax=Gallibacterium genomosp. 3 TaxID=505345 RepID=A0A1A7Q2A5_9PAST|nr:MULTISPECIES: D-ribose pyranase [Gallibacterium]MDA3979670.1 D-ribose pyranase [Gallibacterium sp. AGMB14963]OBW92161.1 D-ribose pyranase [Gallibacterium genomosp. 3]OBX08062.1 D-ribose pyranase [Gallibacterium genomosp. 3]
MKKVGILNAHLSHVIATLGHTDLLTICDAGLPIPKQADCVDLALTPGIPSFLASFDAVISECFVEKVILAEEIKQKNPLIHNALLQRLEQLSKQQNNQIEIDYVSHTEFKQLSQASKGFVRSGECTPYANIIISCGVPF